ncbi:hypothetical protein GOP47_0014514 [Adiantum capillus-veneris]|uniref:Replication protein A subunit n=1 Tax=Adiantum capillus-veneris TaxID=13818 RepID=A0A9D4UME1_ADICA|nr:hypothetical protein GOP47_0014514 [Adiantum capillus-veneris]
MSISLTPNAIVALNNGQMDSQPVVQVLDVRQIGTGQSVQERYRLVLSDGHYVQQGMLATQLNEHIKSGQVLKGSIVKLVEYICNTVQQRKIIIVLNMEVVASVSEIIGDPKQVIMNDPPTNSGSTASAEQQQKPSMQAPVPLSYPQQQPEVLSSMANANGFRPGQGAGIHQVSGTYSKDGAAAFAQTGSFQGHVENSGGGPSHRAGGLALPTPVQASNTYGRPIGAPTSYQPSPMYSNRGPIAMNEAAARIVPIAALNPYQGRWTIKARVTSKGDIRRFNNAKGEGKVFSFDLLDAEGGEIRVTCFNNVADQFYEQLEVGGIYMISKGSLKPAQRNFNHLKNDWEIFLENSSIVERCFDEDGTIPQQQFDFKPISEVGNLEGNAMVDVVGVVVSINPTTTIMRKNGTEVQKRTLHLRDASGCSVEVTMWGAFCNSEGQQLQEMCDSGLFPILAVKGGRISDFGGKSIGTVSSSQLLINPNLPQALQTKAWFEQGGKSSVAQPISKEGGGGPRLDMRKTVSQIKDEGLGRSDKPDWIALRATISFIKTDNFCYTACPLPVGDRQCNKKVVSNGDGTWRCDRCDKAVAECDYRYLLSVQVQDHTGITWITAFQDAGEEIMGVSAKDLFTWKENENPKFKESIQKLLFTQYVFKLKVKEEHYNDEMRVKCTAIKSERLDFAGESKVLIDAIRKISRGEQLNEPPSATVGLPPAGYSNGTLGMPTAGYSNSTTPGTSGHFGSLEGGNIGGFRSTAVGSGHANGGSNGYGNASCFKCGGAHYARDCSTFSSERAVNQSMTNYGGGFNGAVGSTSSCFKCGQGGHWARDCPGHGMNGSFGREMNYGGYVGNVGYGRGF